MVSEEPQEVDYWKSEASGIASELAEVRKAIEREYAQARSALGVLGGEHSRDYFFGRWDLSRKLLAEFWEIPK